MGCTVRSMESSDQSGLSKVQLWPLKVLLLIIISPSPRMPSYSVRNSVWKDSTSMAWVHVITACIFLWLSIEGIDCRMAHNHVLIYVISQNYQYCTFFQEMMLFVHHFLISRQFISYFFKKATFGWLIILTFWEHDKGKKVQPDPA